MDLTSPGTFERTSLGTGEARQLSTTTKTRPQMQAISSRWLLRILPWVDVKGGVYRVNRRLAYRLRDSRLAVFTDGGEVRMAPQELRLFGPLRGFEDEATLRALAERFVRRDYEPGQRIVERDQSADRVVVIARGKAQKLGPGKYGEDIVLDVLFDGDHVGYQELVGGGGRWQWTIQALVPTTVLELRGDAFQEVLALSDALRDHVQSFLSAPRPAQNRQGEVAIARMSGHGGEPALPHTFVAYDTGPREYHLSLSQTVLRVHTRVSDLYSDPMDQVGEQLRLTIEALREEQEDELVNNRGFGLLQNVDPRQRISTSTGPPTPSDLDELLTRRRKTRCFLAHSRAIAAFGRECSRRGLYPEPVEVMGKTVPSWRGVPLLSCNKIPIAEDATTSVLAFRTGEADQGVVGLYQTGLAEEHGPGLNVRRMGVDARGVTQYLVSAYYSAAVLVPDALGALDNVEVGH